MLNDSEVQRLRHQLHDLEEEHRDLDEIIERLARDVTIDQLQMARLKKRKLRLKDQISRLRSLVIPDTPA